ncbi:MAG: hypothetical protein P9M15_08130 [Candidatus Electryoneaceae bacterium]|nr:hypothetical protein [Candidatus Electryoneaceae bacterium]
MKKDIEQAERVFQNKLDELLKDGAECVVLDVRERVTSFCLASLEVLKAVPFFSRSTGKVLRFTYWCWMQEIHYEAGMQRSHLLRAIQVEWFNDRNLQLKTDDYGFLICALDPPEVDQIGNDVYNEWHIFQKANPWLEKVTMEQREEFLDIVRRAVS